MNFKPSSPESSPRPPKVKELKDLKLTLNSQGLPVSGSNFETRIIYDNGASILVKGIVKGSFPKDGQLYAVIEDEKLKSLVNFPVPSELIAKAKNVHGKPLRPRI